MVFKLKKTNLVDTYPIHVGLRFRRSDNEHIRTLTYKERYPIPDNEMDEGFVDDSSSIWTRGYLINKFKSKQFKYLGFK